MFTVGIIGVGYWGSNYVRVFHEQADCRLKWCVDLDSDRLSELEESYRDIRTSTDYTDVLTDDAVDAVCIATPPATHYDITTASIEHGKHLLVEKPFTLDSDRAWDLQQQAEAAGVTVLVGHVFEYNSAVRELRSFVKDGHLGEIHYLHAERTGLGPIRPNVSALWDLAPHDISTYTYVLEDRVESVRCIGRSFLQEVDDSVFVFLEFADGTSGFVHCSWLYPHKTRKTTVVGDERMAVFNDTDPERILQVYESGVDRVMQDPPDLTEHRYQVREGDVVVPYVDQREPLQVQVEHFFECIREDKSPITGAADGARVVEILEAAQRSRENGGQVVDV